MTGYLVAGTQSESPQQNFLLLMKMSHLKETRSEEDEDSEWPAGTRLVLMCVAWPQAMTRP